MQYRQVVLAGEREHIVETEPGAAGASTSVLPGTMAATWASQVGYQNDLISRFA